MARGPCSARTLADETALSFARGAIEGIASNWRAAASEWAEKASGLTTSWAAQRAAVVDAWTSPMMDRAAAAATAEAVASIAIEADRWREAQLAVVDEWARDAQLHTDDWAKGYAAKATDLYNGLCNVEWVELRTNVYRFSAIRRQSRRPWQLARRETSPGGESGAARHQKGGRCGRTLSTQRATAPAVERWTRIWRAGMPNGAMEKSDGPRRRRMSLRRGWRSKSRRRTPTSCRLQGGRGAL